MWLKYYLVEVLVVCGGEADPLSPEQVGEQVTDVLVSAGDETDIVGALAQKSRVLEDSK